MTRNTALLILVASLLVAGCTAYGSKAVITTTYITNNMIYAQAYGVDIGAVPIASSGIYYNVSGTVSDLDTGFIFNDSGNYELTALQGGVYKIATQWSFSGTANTEYHLSVAVNYVQRDQCHAERKIGKGRTLEALALPVS